MRRTKIPFVTLFLLFLCFAGGEVHGDEPASNACLPVSSGIPMVGHLLSLRLESIRPGERIPVVVDTSTASVDKTIADLTSSLGAFTVQERWDGFFSATFRRGQIRKLLKILPNSVSLDLSADARLNGHRFLEDLDGNGILDDLDARLTAAPAGEPLSVFVRLGPVLSDGVSAILMQQAGPFTIRWSEGRVFVASWTPEQIRTLAGHPFLAGISALDVAAVAAEYGQNLAEPAVDSKEAKSSVLCKTIAQQAFSRRDQSGYYLIATNQRWRKLWESALPGVDLPEVAFGKDVAIAVFQGRVPSTGYSITITQVEKMADKLSIHIQETSPSFGCPVDPLATAPLHIVNIGHIPKRLQTRVEYLVERNFAKCP